MPYCEIGGVITTRRVSFEVAFFQILRAKGPAIYLAQPNGLGNRKKFLRAEGRTVCRVLPSRRSKWPGRWPCDIGLFSQHPALQAGLGKRPGLCPSIKKMQLQNSRAGLMNQQLVSALMNRITPPNGSGPLGWMSERFDFNLSGSDSRQRCILGAGCLQRVTRGRVFWHA